MNANLLSWDSCEVENYLLREKIDSKEIVNAVRQEKIDGKTLLLLNERDLYTLESKYNILLGDLKRFSLIIHKLQSQNRNCLVYLGLLDNRSNLINNLLSNSNLQHYTGPSFSHHHHHNNSIVAERNRLQDVEISPANSVDGSSSGKCFATCIQPEFFKTVVSLGEKW
jgi:hypothetical protein